MYIKAEGGGEKAQATRRKASLNTISVQDTGACNKNSTVESLTLTR